jgi:hypothetical protein
VFYTLPESPFVRVADNGWDSLLRCNRCGSYWEANGHDMHVITAAQARASFPEAGIDEPSI